MLLAMGLCQLTCGHWQVTVQELSALISPALNDLFNQQLLCPRASPQLSLGSTPLSVMQAGSKTQAATSEVLLYIQVTDCTCLRQTEAKQRHLK